MNECICLQSLQQFSTYKATKHDSPQFFCDEMKHSCNPHESFNEIHINAFCARNNVITQFMHI